MIDYRIAQNIFNYRYGRGESSVQTEPVKTLSWSPMNFVPSVRLKGLTWNSISIGWSSPETVQISKDTPSRNETETRNYLNYITYYKLTRKTDNHEVRDLMLSKLVIDLLRNTP